MLRTDESGFIWQDSPTNERVWAVAWADDWNLDEDNLDPLPMVRSFHIGFNSEDCPRNWLLP